MAHVLVIDDESTYARNVASYLARGGHNTVVADTLQTGLSAYRQSSPDVIILDFMLPDGSGIEFLRAVRPENRSVHIMLVTGHGSIQLAVDTMREGANDLITKPVSLHELRSRVDAVVEQQSQRRGAVSAAPGAEEGALLGDAPVMVALRQRVHRVAGAGAGAGAGLAALPVLIMGETGSGKATVARAIHTHSPRSHRRFATLRCGSLPSADLEVELFGREAADTYAVSRSPAPTPAQAGLIDAADGGTLFLDEVGDLDACLQAKLLRLIEEGRFRRVGATHERSADVRIVACTSRDLPSLVAEGRFRADLYFRLRVLQLSIPALRDRGSDAVLLARHFATVHGHRYGRPRVHLSERADAAILAHRWPGNVRELRNVIEQAVLLSESDRLEAVDLMLPSVARTEAPEGLDSALSTIDRMERAMMMEALEAAGGNVSQAARVLGITRDTFRYRMDKYGLKGP